MEDEDQMLLGLAGVLVEAMLVLVSLSHCPLSLFLVALLLLCPEWNLSLFPALVLTAKMQLK